jgi:hypothetical protein
LAEPAFAETPDVDVDVVECLDDNGFAREVEAPEVDVEQVEYGTLSSGSASSRPQRPQPQASTCYVEVLGAIRESCRHSRSEINDASKKVESVSRRPLCDAEISLIEFEGASMFVRWEDVGAGTCRCIYLDSFNRIIYNIPFMVPLLRVLGYKVLIVDTEATMKKMVARHRFPMHQWCLAFHRAQQARLLEGPTTLHGPCILHEMCALKHVQAPFAVDESGDCFLCTRCTQVWHAKCVESICPPRVELCFTTFVCPMCLQPDGR